MHGSGRRQSQILSRPLELARRSIGATLRVLAGRCDIEVRYGAGKASVQGSVVYLPGFAQGEPPQDLTPLRGMADEAAFLFRHHDVALHCAFQPQGEKAAQAYAALAQARVEALGAQRFPGALANIGAALEHAAQLEGYARAKRQEEIPLHWAIRLIAREYFLGGRLHHCKPCSGLQ